MPFLLLLFNTCVEFTGCQSLEERKKKKNRRTLENGPNKRFNFFQSKLDFSNLKVSVEFSDGEHGLNCGFEF